MIDINLMPSGARKKNVSGLLSSISLGLPQDIVLGIIVAFCALLLVFHLCLAGLWGITEISLLMRQGAWQGVLPDKQRIDALGNEVKDAKKKLDSLNEITATKGTGWSRKLNVLSDAVTKGLWLRRISLDGKVLILEGTVLAKNQNEISLVNAFVEALKKDAFFMRDVASIDVGGIQRTKKGATDVANFTLTVKMN